MIKTLLSILITLAVIFGMTAWEIAYVEQVFVCFHNALCALHQKTEHGIATYEDGTAIRAYWESKKDVLYVWLPHAMLWEVDYQLSEAIGFLYESDSQSALPKIEILINLSENIPESYRLKLGNIF